METSDQVTAELLPPEQQLTSALNTGQTILPSGLKPWRKGVSGNPHGRPSNNAHTILKRLLGKNLADFEASKAEIFDATLRLCLMYVTEDKLKKASVGTLVTAAAICEDKARNARGQATSINVTALVDVAEMLRNK